MYIVIELSNPEWPTIVCDENGKPKIFIHQEEAIDEMENCEDGIYVLIS